MEVAAKLTNVQIELLKMFRYDLPETQLVEIKNLLTDHFAKTATAEMDKLWDDSNWDNGTMKDWASEHLRKK